VQGEPILTGPIRVLVADDHLVVRRGLATLLLAFNDLMLVGEAQNGAEALELCATLQPDVVLMDLLMPEVDGVAATRWPEKETVYSSAGRADRRGIDTLGCHQATRNRASGCGMNTR